MSYSISVPQAMKYELTLDAASENGGVQIVFSCGGNTLGTLDIPSTGGWQNWQQFKVTLELPAGDSDLKLYAQQGGYNIDKMTFKASVGDINRDGSVSAADAVMLCKYLIGNEQLSDEQAKQADLDHNQVINAVDLTLLKLMLLRQ